MDVTPSEGVKERDKIKLSYIQVFMYCHFKDNISELAKTKNLSVKYVQYPF